MACRLAGLLAYRRNSFTGRTSLASGLCVRQKRTIKACDERGRPKTMIERIDTCHLTNILPTLQSQITWLDYSLNHRLVDYSLE